MKKLLIVTALGLALAAGTAAYAMPEMHDGPPPFLKEALSKLPKEDADKVRDAMKAGREKNSDLMEKMHALHDDIYNILTAEKFDKDAFIAKSEEMQKLQAQVLGDMMTAFASAVSGLPVDERETLADAMEKMHPMMERRHHDDDEDADRPSSHDDDKDDK